MIGDFKVITLCGSTKFKDQFIEEQKRLSLEGNVVISVGLFGHSGDNEVWTEGTKEMLDNIHKRKIDLADEIFVINKNGYIGESTKSEIEYAINTGKIVNYMVDIKEIERKNISYASYLRSVLRKYILGGKFNDEGNEILSDLKKEQSNENLEIICKRIDDLIMRDESENLNLKNLNKTNRLKKNLIAWLIYSLICYIIIMPFQMWITGISISILIGFFFGLMNDTITQLRKLNGEKFTKNKKHLEIKVSTNCSCDNGIIDCPGCKGDKSKPNCAGCLGKGKVTCGKCGGSKNINYKKK